MLLWAQVTIMFMQTIKSCLKTKFQPRWKVISFTFENSLFESGVLTGKFEVVIIAFGADKIASEKSEVLEFRRLDKVKGFQNNK